MMRETQCKPGTRVTIIDPSVPAHWKGRVGVILGRARKRDAMGDPIYGLYLVDFGGTKRKLRNHQMMKL